MYLLLPDFHCCFWEFSCLITIVLQTCFLPSHIRTPLHLWCTFILLWCPYYELLLTTLPGNSWKFRTGRFVSLINFRKLTVILSLSIDSLTFIYSLFRTLMKCIFCLTLSLNPCFIFSLSLSLLTVFEVIYKNLLCQAMAFFRLFRIGYYY